MFYTENSRMMKEERDHFFQPSLNKKYLAEREAVISRMLALGQKIDLSQHTLHLGVKLLDRVFAVIDEGAISSEQFDLVAAVCMMLGAKFDELDYKVPLLCDIAAISKNKLNYFALKQTEEDLLGLLDFNFMLNTPLSVLRFLLAQGILFSDD